MPLANPQRVLAAAVLGIFLGGRSSGVDEMKLLYQSECSHACSHAVVTIKFIQHPILTIKTLNDQCINLSAA